MNITKLPNIILIVCDTLSAKHMSLYGYNRRTTPNLERLVEEKGFTVYESCYSTSCWTPPTHASIFTGLYPHEHGVHELNYCLPNNLNTLPEVLKMMGYYTVGISCNGLIGFPTNFNKGFDIFIELEKWRIFNENTDDFKQIREYISTEKSELTRIIKIFQWAIKTRKILTFLQCMVNFLYTGIKANNKGWFGVLRNATPYTKKAFKIASKLINGFQTKPLFLFINVMQTHRNYNPPLNYRNIWSNPKSPYKKYSRKDHWLHYKKPFPAEAINYLKDLYDEEVLFLDKTLSDFARNIFTLNNMIIITSDHGEHFGEYGHLEHILSLHDPVVKVPLLIKYPFSQRYEIVPNLVQINDIYATIMDLVRCPMPTPLSSKSLLSSEKRKKAYMEIVHPEVWLNLIKDGRFRDEKFVRIVDNVKQKT